jgi:HK97 family phage portal protein
MAPGILTIQGAGLLDEKKKAARSRAFVRQQNNSANGPIVLDDLETYQPLEIKSDIAKLLAQVDWTSRQVAKVYGVPDSYLNGAGDQQSNLDQENNQYAKALKRFVGPIASELNSKLNATVTPDLRPSVDAIGDNYANKISSMVQDSIISANQAQFILKRLGYLPQDLPTDQPEKGGDNNENNSNEG